jgi:hypothetical protein
VPKPAYPTGLQRAALVGINYLRTPYELAGCINDVIDMQAFLKQLYPACNEYRVITDQTDVQPTRANILATIDWLVADLKPGQNVYFHFSGHGGQVRDTNGDEVSGMDSCIYPCNRGVMETITDDELRTLLAARVPAGCKAFVVLDCCHSGTAVDLRYLWAAPAATSLSYYEDKKYATLPGTVVFLSGCQDAQVAADTALRARAAAIAVAEALDYHGVMCLELFELEDGRLLANEIAPRPHNSGHWTLDAASHSQFEQQVRVIAGLPLADPQQRAPAVMVNLLGELWRDGEPDWACLLGDAQTRLWLYGKAGARAGRKMGHFTCIDTDVVTALRRAEGLRQRLASMTPRATSQARQPEPRAAALPLY